MAASQEINYALISALYANGKSGFYHDVYFPIIKYSIVQLFKNKSLRGGEQYYTAQDVQDIIEETFKIRIPHIVIAKSLERINQGENKCAELLLMENGESFHIKGIWDSQELDQLSEQEDYFSKGLRNIEEEYRRYLEQNGTYDDGVSYLQFIADNTEEVLGYFQNNDVSVVNEKYATIIFFLEYLRHDPSKREEYSIADKLFWASIIAGFLKSDKPIVNAAIDGGVKEYFLDTSILLGMLDLSSSQKEKYSKEINEIIKSSGGMMRVHPMTLEEIRIILLSVEASGGPAPGTDIAEACVNHKLNLNRLANIRLNLQARLQEKGVQLFPIWGPDECRKKASMYAGRTIVKELAYERSRTPRYSNDDFREIHDIFMDDYIKDRRKEKGGSDDVVFVTMNRELITFTKDSHPGFCYMMSSGRLVLDLWMHNVKPADISECALTETMARCLDQHNVRVRSKINEVSRFFNENKGEFNDGVYRDFISKLYQRARNVITTIENDPDEQDMLGQLTAQRIMDAVKADQEYIDKQRGVSEREKAALSKQLEEETKLKDVLAGMVKTKEEELKNMAREKDDLAAIINDARKNESREKQRAERERVAKEAAEKKLELYKEKERLLRQKQEDRAKLEPLEIRRGKSFSNALPNGVLLLGIALIIGAIVTFIFSYDNSRLWCGGPLCALGIFFFTRFCALKNKTDIRRNKAYEKWEKKPENKEYQLIKRRLDEAEQRLSEIELELNKSDDVLG